MNGASSITTAAASCAPYDLPMAQCTAPVRGHIRGGGADCPVHGRSYRGYGGYGSYGSYYSSYSPPVYTPPPTRRYPSYASRSSGGGGGRSSSSRARRSSVTYSTGEYQTLNPVREQVVRIAQTYPDRRDLFLCHAWDDREGAALDLYNLLVGLDVKVWFSEKDVPLGTSLLRQIDKGLANSRAGIVLVTPALLKSIQSDGHRRQGTVRTTRNRPRYPGRARHNVRGTAGREPAAGRTLGAEHCRIVVGGRGHQGRGRGAARLSPAHHLD